MSGYYRQPSLYRDQVVFVSEDDLWLADVHSAHCYRLTIGLGVVSHPLFSPCGGYIAFCANHAGADEVYVIPSNGGQAKRLTFLGQGCQVVAWADSEYIVFASAVHSPFRQNSLYRVSRHGTQALPVAVGPANAISYGPKDGDCVIQRHGYGYPSWKRYAGGLAGQLWLRKGEAEFTHIAPRNANMLQPTWQQDRIYFLSDYQGHGNIYSCDLQGYDLKRHTQHEDFYVLSYSVYEQTAVYCQNGLLWQVNLEENHAPAHRLDISPHSSSAHLLPKFADQPDQLESATLSPDGEHIALCNRGRLFYMPTWQGGSYHLSDQADKRYKHVCFLADKKLLAVCDEGANDAIHLFDLTHPGIAKSWLDLDLGRVLKLHASPDGKQVLISNHRHECHLFNVASGKLLLLARSAYGLINLFDWSHDSAWIAYSFANSHESSVLRLYHLKSKQTTALTSGQYADYSPCFDPKGRYLYFLSQRIIQPRMDEVSFQYNCHNSSQVYVFCLQKDQPTPFLHQPCSDINPDEDKASAKKATAAEKTVALKIDIDGLSERLVSFPLAPGRYSALLATADSVLILTEDWHDDSHAGESSKEKDAGRLLAYHLKEQSHETLLEGITSAGLNAKHTWMLYYHEHKLRVVSAGSKPDNSDKSYRSGGWIDLSRCRIAIDPKQEWQFIFTEAWRLQRDYYWDAHMGGLDWDAILTRYQPSLARINTRAELSALIAEMQGELGCSHAYVWGGDSPKRRHYPIGYLGCETKFCPKRQQYEIVHIYHGEPGSAQCAGPLTQPGIDAAVGDYIIAINGQTLDENTPPESRLVHQAGKHVNIRIQRGSKASGAKDFVVKTLSSLRPLLYRRWVEQNRRYVHDKSSGKLGYIHIPDMGKAGIAEFIRSYQQTYDAAGLIVDVRFNGGGHVSTIILQKLALKRFGLDLTRWHQANFAYPIGSPKGAMVAICNENAGSDGDMFSHAFKHLRLGPLIGKRTWGGVVGINVRNALLDGGVTTQPEYAVWFDGVHYGVENHGVCPDESIEITPEQSHSGKDPQLDRAIELALADLAQDTYVDLDASIDQCPRPNKVVKPLPETA